MEPISQGMQGPAVEDVQTRLSSLGYMIDAAEMTAKLNDRAPLIGAVVFRAEPFTATKRKTLLYFMRSRRHSW